MDNPDLESAEESLNELGSEPEEGYLDDEYNPDGFNPDDGLDSPIAGEPPFENSLPASDPDLSSMGDEFFEPDENDYDEIPYTKEDANTPDEDTVIDDDSEYSDDYDSSEYYEDFPTG